MLNKYSYFYVILSLLLILSGCAQLSIVDPAATLPPDSPITIITGENTIENWVVLGPFPAESSDTLLPDGTYDIGFTKDFLESIGGETAVILQPSIGLGELQSQTVGVDGVGIVDLAKLYNGAD